MTICYFSATGNSLYAARRIGGTLGNMIFGGHRCHRHHWHRHGGFLGRGLLLGTLLGLFMSRANQNRTEEK